MGKLYLKKANRLVGAVLFVQATTCATIAMEQVTTVRRNTNR